MVGIRDSRRPQRPIVVGDCNPAGTFTDDTQMTVAIAEGLLEAGIDDFDAATEAVSRRRVACNRSPKTILRLALGRPVFGCSCPVSFFETSSTASWQHGQMPSYRVIG